MSEEFPHIMCVKDVARYLGVHPISVYRLVKDSDIPVGRVGGQWRFRKDLLDEWLFKQSVSKTK